MSTFTTTVNLPDQYLKTIARIILYWSVAELVLKRITYHLLSLDEKRGRIAVRDPRVVDQITMIQQLMSLARIDEKPFHLDKLKKSVEGLQAFRDRIAHGLWGKYDGTDDYYLRDISGHWRPDPKGPKVSRRVTPTGEQVTLAQLANKANEITQHVDAFKAILAALQAQSPSQDKPPE